MAKAQAPLQWRRASWGRGHLALARADRRAWPDSFRTDAPCGALRGQDALAPKARHHRRAHAQSAMCAIAPSCVRPNVCVSGKQGPCGRVSRMPSLRGHVLAKHKRPCNGDGPLGGEGILPSHAPTGAHGLTRFEPMRLAAHCEGKMPSPPRGPPPSQGARSIGDVRNRPIVRETECLCVGNQGPYSPSMTDSAPNVSTWNAIADCTSSRAAW